MKHKVGDKVRIKSKEWWDAQPKDEYGSVECGKDTFTDYMTCMCGKIVEIKDILDTSCDLYSIKEHWANWTDEMFDDLYNPEKSILSEEMIKDIAEVVKKHNLGVCVSENDGKLIIEPLKAEKEEDLPIDTPVMVADSIDNWIFRYYEGNGKCFLLSYKSKDERGSDFWKYIIPFDKFNPNNIEESLKYNIVKS